MWYHIQPLDGPGFLLIDEGGADEVGSLALLKITGTIAFGGEVMVRRTPAREASDGREGHARVVIGHGPPGEEVVEAAFDLEGW